MQASTVIKKGKDGKGKGKVKGVKGDLHTGISLTHFPFTPKVLGSQNRWTAGPNHSLLTIVNHTVVRREFEEFRCGLASNYVS